VDELASSKYEHCYYSNITYEHSGFRFQIVNGTLFVDHLPWHNYWGGVVSHALTPDPYNECVPCIWSLSPWVPKYLHEYLHAECSTMEPCRD